MEKIIMKVGSLIKSQDFGLGIVTEINYKICPPEVTYYSLRYQALKVFYGITLIDLIDQEVRVIFS